MVNPGYILHERNHAHSQEHHHSHSHEHHDQHDRHERHHHHEHHRRHYIHPEDPRAHHSRHQHEPHEKAAASSDPSPSDMAGRPSDSQEKLSPPTTGPAKLLYDTEPEEFKCWPSLQVIDEGDLETGSLARVRLRGKEFQVCRRSLYIFPLKSCFRRHVIELVTWFFFDKFILFLILFNSLCLASYDHRSPDSGFNWVSDNVFDPILTCFFTLEFVLKVIAFGFVLDETSYLRDAWNWLDFVVVVTGLLQVTNAMSSEEGVGFLRMFRILRPLRSLNAVPQMKVLVNTVLSSIPRLGNVSIMAAFLFCTFGILGMSLFSGVFYRSCRRFAQPLLLGSNGTECWSWPQTGEMRLCGGRYLCEDSPLGEQGHCGGHPADPNELFRPSFEGGQRGFPWCSGSEPLKVFPESEWISFDNLGTALITIFQCMTVEGWTDVMYRIQDGYGFEVATVYFFLLIPVTSFFLLNVALAVVDEAREDFAEEAADEALEEELKLAQEVDESELTHHSSRPRPSGRGWMGSLVGAAEDMTRAMSKALDVEQSEEEEALWWDSPIVRFLKAMATNEVFTSVIMCFIAANVVTMMLDGYPPILEIQDFLATSERVFLVIFCLEMCILIGAFGPCRYLRTPVMCFDGVIVVASVVQVLTSPDGQGGAIAALRTLRLFRVLNKLASRWPSFRVLLKAMLYTGKSLSYWIVLFSLVLYICTLMFLQLFATKFHFVDVDTLAEVGPDQGQPWCQGTEALEEPFRQDCIPRANFDTFLWALVSIFQIMTGENWNTIMYAGMRAQGWIFGAFFVGLIIFGQILFLSLFLSMLLSKFDEVQDEMEQKEAEKLSKSKKEVGTTSLRSLFRAASTLRVVAETWREAVQEKKVSPEEDVLRWWCLNEPVARCLKLETPGSYRVELFLENETEVALHRFNQCFPQSHARLASPDDQLQKRPKQQTPGEEAEPHSPEATKPLRHLEQQLQELEDLLRQPGAREAAAEAAAHAVAPAAPPAELPAETETEESSDDEAAEGLLKLTLGRGTLDVSLHLRAAAGGGTGARLWTGGVLLAEWLLQAEQAELLKGKQVLELGAGAAALPSVAAAAGAGAVVATEGVEEVVAQMRRNLQANAPAVRGEQLWWQHTGRRRYRKKEQFDVVLFADGVYTERGAWLLADAATALLRPSGTLIGALPDLRAGMSSFEEDLSARGLVGSEVSLDQEIIDAASRPYDEDSRGLVAGGSAKDYRLILWRYSQEVTAASKRTATPPPKKKEVVPTPRPPEAAAKPAATKAVAPSEEKAPNLKSEWGNIALLCLLYLGLSGMSEERNEISLQVLEWQPERLIE
ncbi:unnamed protein product [Durusdinium trenchii]|uniref:Ion transport domain-containing protein n=1 Tax=Durusdinium trenchii TaxID=1381693 RepID=A0ABP0N1I7_9DINO